MENVIPSATSLAMFTQDVPVTKEEPTPKSIKVSKTITKRPVGHQKKDLFKRPSKETPQPVKEVPKPEVQSQTVPVPAEKPKKQKRKMSEKQLAHLARIRKLAAAKRAENKRLRDEMKKKDPKVQKTKAKKQQFETEVKQHQEDKEAKRARKKQEQIDLFNEMYNEREQIRLANKERRQAEKAKAKEARRAEKMKLYQQLLDSGAVSVNQPGKKAPNPAKKAPAPTKKAPAKKNPVKKVKFEKGRMVTYTDYE